MAILIQVLLLFFHYIYFRKKRKEETKKEKYCEKRNTFIWIMMISCPTKHLIILSAENNNQFNTMYA